MTSSGKALVFAAVTSLLSLALPARAQAQARLAFVGAGEVSPRLSNRVAAALSREWQVEVDRVVLSWGSGTPGPGADSAAFKLVGGENGWFSLMLQPPRGPGTWVRLRAGITVELPVATHALRPGTVLSEDDFRREPRIHWGPLPAEPEAEPAAGWVVRRPIAGGEVLEGFRVAPPPVVTAGKPVRMYYVMGSVTVAIDGVALNDAAVGQPVRVRTRGQRAVVAGTAVAPGEARMQ